MRAQQRPAFARHLAGSPRPFEGDLACASIHGLAEALPGKP